MNQKSGGLFVIGFLAMFAILAIVIVQFRSKCKIPDENTCEVDPDTGETRFPYCSTSIGEYQCKPISQVCTNDSLICGENQERYCDWNSPTPSYKCRDTPPSPPPPPPETCDIGEDGKLPFPRHKGNTIMSNTEEPVVGYQSYTLRNIGGINVCELDSCTSDYNTIKPTSDQFGWCEPKDAGQMCTPNNNNRYPGDTHDIGDRNANFVTAYTYPGDTQYCQFQGCKDGWQEGTGNKCTKIQHECGDPPKFAKGWQYDENKGRCVIVGGCRDDGTFLYGPDDSGTSCIKSGCIVEDPQVTRNLSDGCKPSGDDETIKYFLFGGSDPAAKCTLPLVKNNAKLKNNRWVVDPPSESNVYGGCGSKDCPDYFASKDGTTCEQSFKFARVLFNYRGSDSYDSTLDEGCIQCLDLHCPPNAENPSQCNGWQENCGSWETSTRGKIDDVIKSCVKKNQPTLNGTGFMFGPIQKSGLKNKLNSSARGAPIVIDTDNLSIELNVAGSVNYDNKWTMRIIKPDGTTIVSTTRFDPDNTRVYNLNLVKNGFLQFYRSKDFGYNYMRTQDFLFVFKKTGSNKFYIKNLGGTIVTGIDNKEMPIFNDSLPNAYSPYFELKNGDLCLGTSDKKNLKFDKCDSSSFMKNFMYNTQLSGSNKTTGGQYALKLDNGFTPYYCIDLPGGDQKSGKTIKLYNCHGSKSKDKSHQQWDLPDSDGRIKFTNSTGGGYWLFNNNSNLTLEGADSAGKPESKFTRNS